MSVIVPSDAPASVYPTDGGPMPWKFTPLGVAAIVAVVAVAVLFILNRLPPEAPVHLPTPVLAWIGTVAAIGLLAGIAIVALTSIIVLLRNNGLPLTAALTILILLAVAAAVPALNLWVDPESTFHIPNYLVPLVGKYLCYALLALSVGLIWGYAGILSLGHGAFFALGGYAMGMYLMRQIGPRGVYGHPYLPDFMVFLNWQELPWYWLGFDNFWFAALMVLLIPGTLAFVFGWFAFRSRVTGVYLSIITQALTYALLLAFFRNDMGFGGNNGMTDFKELLGFTVAAQETRAGLFAASAVALALGYLVSRLVVSSKAGKVLVAVRDAESRTRFLGYRVERYKLFVFVLSAVMAGVAGALYVPQVGIINPGEFAPANSIEAVVWVAVGGRGTLVGPIVGGTLVSALKTYFTGGATATYWTIAILPALALLLLAWVRRKVPLAQGPLAGAAAGALVAALAFVLPASIAAWWGLGIAALAGLVWIVAGAMPLAAGAVFGALIVALIRTPMAQLPLAPYWLFLLGGIFVVVTLLLPRGIIGTILHGGAALRERRASLRAEEGIEVPSLKAAE